MHHGGDVAGLPMAMTAPDRDGLELDALQVSLGPVLPGWPTGLVVRAMLHGDVLTGVTATWIDADAARDRLAQPPTDSKLVALDSLARFLTVAGWTSAAYRARRARDGWQAADAASIADAERAAARLAATVRRSRILTWSMRPARTAGPATDSSRSLEQSSATEVVDRVRAWCAILEGHHDDVPTLAVTALAPLLEGTELATARLIVASWWLEPAPTRQEQEQEVGHG